MKTKPVFEVPALDIDGVLFKGRSMPAHCKLERRIIYNLMLHLEANGFRVTSVYDGEEDTRLDLDFNWADATLPPNPAKQAMELIFNLDEASIRFASKATEFGTEHGVLYIGGNGEDCISDWNYDDGDADGFNKAMDEFDPSDFQ